MNTLITICARGGSKGIPGKNIKELGGKPLIHYTIELARLFAERTPGTTIALSTDSQQIKDVAAACGLESDYQRPESLAGDSVGKIAAIADVVAFSEKEGVQYDYILDMDVTSPLRNIDDLEAAFKILSEDKDALNIFSVSPANRNPYFNMVEQKENGYYNKIKSLGDVYSRQAAPKVYDLNASFYIYKREFFEKSLTGAITERSLIYEVPHLCFDLDNPIDFEFISYLIDNNRLDFKLC